MQVMTFFVCKYLDTVNSQIFKRILGYECLTLTVYKI